MALAPLDPSFATRVRQSFARQPFLAALGARVTRVEPGEVDIELLFRADLTQQHGYLHAGVVTTLADNAAGYASLTLMPPGAAVLTAELKLNLLAPSRGERFVARGRVVKPGRTLTVAAGDVFAVEGGVERHVATMLATMAVVEGRGISD